jgi:hypothetical protein
MEILMTPVSLIQPLFDGKVDIVGDVHGHIGALRALLHHLGYGEDGSHPDGRQPVFVGDLTDRGPDSPAVVRFIKQLVDSGRAQCVLGNHDFNILCQKAKKENPWFYGKAVSASNSLEPEVTADDDTRRMILGFFRTLPLALERSDLRVVHAFWDEAMVDICRRANCAITVYEEHFHRIQNDLDGVADVCERKLAHQNRNPVKLLTSGPEERALEPFIAGGEKQCGARVRWWETYQGEPFCIFGHYSRPYGEPHGRGRAICIDYGVAYRGHRQDSGLRLAAARFPEMKLVFDDGQEELLVV